MSKSTERGQALILIALAAVGLFAFAALAIDGSRSFSNKRHAQNAADTAVLAAALAHIREPVEANKFAAASTAALQRAGDNGFVTNGDITIVEVNLCSDPGITCEGIDTAHPEQYLRVRIKSQIPSTFGRVIGWEVLESAAEAIARVQGSSSTSSFPDEAVVALNKTGCAICNSGNGNLTVNNSGVFSNSTTACNPPDKGSMDFNGNVTIFATDGFTRPDPGDICFTGNADFGVGSGGEKSGSQISPVYNIPAPNITCPSTEIGWKDDIAKIVHPGNFSTKLSLPNGTWTFISGENYCFADGADIGANITATDVNFRIDGGQIKHTGDIFTCTNTIIYGAGGSGMHFNGNGNNTCTSVTFYMASGGVTWNGTSEQNLKAPTSGPYKGLLIYLPVGNTSMIRLNGTSDSELVGSVIAPGSQIQLSGVADSHGFDTQLVGAWIDIDGGSETVINYNPNNQYIPPSGPSIELTK